MSEQILNKLLDMMVENRERFDSVDRQLTGVNSRLVNIENRLDKVEHKLDTIEHRLETVESELGTVMDAVLDVGRTVKEHDLAIKDIRARYN